MPIVNTPTLETERLLLRRFTPADVPALFDLLRHPDVNPFLPQLPPQSMAQAEEFYLRHFAAAYQRALGYSYAITLQGENRARGYVVQGVEGGYDFGYAIDHELWGKGLTTEASRAVLDRMASDGQIPFLTATHDRDNVASGKVLQKLGLTYHYTYTENWQAKNKLVHFRLYQRNFTMPDDFVFPGYPVEIARYVEEIL